MIMFLFGSGADTCYNSRLKAGSEFNEELLTNGFKKLRKNVLGDEFSQIDFIHPNSKKVFAQTIFYNEENARKVFDNAIVDCAISYYQGNAKSNIELDKLFESSYKSLKNIDSNPKYRSFYLENANLFDVLDEKFNSLRFPNDLNNNAKRVINAYWTVYFFILQWVYGDINSIKSINDIINLLEKDYCLEPNNPNYYSTVKNSKLKYNIVTTNYTSIAEKYFGEHVVYLHGKLNLFENLNDLQVYTSQELLSSGIDVAENTIIPFILIPSGIKPLICTKQIEAFHDFINSLNDKDCNELCVIGYRFNSEDNHVNSIVGEWLKKEKHHMTVFDYSDDIDFSNYSWSKDFPLDEFEMKSPKDTISIDFGKNKIRRYYIDSEESDYSKKDRIINSCFSTYVKLLEKEI